MNARAVNKYNALPCVLFPRARRMPKQCVSTSRMPGRKTVLFAKERYRNDFSSDIEHSTGVIDEIMREITGEFFVDAAVAHVTGWFLKESVCVCVCVCVCSSVSCFSFTSYILSF